MPAASCLRLSPAVQRLSVVRRLLAHSTMKIKTATSIALWGNIAYFAFQLFYAIKGLFGEYGSFLDLILLFAGPGTLIVFLFTLRQKQP